MELVSAQLHGQPAALAYNQVADQRRISDQTYIQIWGMYDLSLGQIHLRIRGQIEEQLQEEIINGTN